MELIQGYTVKLRELTTPEIKSLSNRYGVKQRSVEEFLMGIGGISMEAAYECLKRKRKFNGWNWRTVNAISDGILLARTKLKYL